MEGPRRVDDDSMKLHGGPRKAYTGAPLRSLHGPFIEALRAMAVRWSAMEGPSRVRWSTMEGAMVRRAKRNGMPWCAMNGPWSAIAGPCRVRRGSMQGPREGAQSPYTARPWRVHEGFS